MSDQIDLMEFGHHCLWITRIDSVRVAEDERVAWHNCECELTEISHHFVSAMSLIGHPLKTGNKSIKLSAPETTSQLVMVSISERGDKNINTAAARRQLGGRGQRAAAGH